MRGFIKKIIKTIEFFKHSYVLSKIRLASKKRKWLIFEPKCSTTNCLPLSTLWFGQVAVLEVTQVYSSKNQIQFDP